MFSPSAWGKSHLPCSYTAIRPRRRGNIRQAINDGPFDIVKYVLTPVILDVIPTQATGDVKFEAVAVQPGSQIVDSTGKLVSLGECLVLTGRLRGFFMCRVLIRDRNQYRLTNRPYASNCAQG